MSAPAAAGTITETAMAFFEACETGKGWEGCSPYCQPDAGFFKGKQRDCGNVFKESW